MGTLLAQELAQRGVRVIVYDPVGSKNSLSAHGENGRFAPSARECIAQSDVVVLATPWKEFLDLTATDWARPGSPRIVVDCWRVLKYLAHVNGVRYLCLGSGSAVQLAAAFVALSSRAD